MISDSTGVPDGGPAVRIPTDILDGSADETERSALADAWHERVRAVLTDDTLFTVESPGSA